MDDLLVNQVTTTYLGDSQVQIRAGSPGQAGERTFEASQRTLLDRPDANFCPLELVAAALGA